MIIVVNRLKVPAGAGERVEQGFQHATGMRDVPGCAGFELWRSADGQEYQVVTRWNTQADFDNWRQSDAFRHAHRDTRGMEQIESKILQYDIVIG